MPTVAADEGNRIVAANGAAADLLGWDPDDLVGADSTDDIAVLAVRPTPPSSERHGPPEG
ncbi:PAS domain-containing protein [Streptomyces sp. IBSBF 2507]